LQAKKFIPLAAFAVLAGLLFRGLSIDPTELPVARLGQPFPDFAQPELTSGRQISVSALVERPALVNVWATWCYSCRVEHPYLLNLAEQGVPIYGLNYKDEPIKAREWYWMRRGILRIGMWAFWMRQFFSATSAAGSRRWCRLRPLRVWRAVSEVCGGTDERHDLWPFVDSAGRYGGDRNL
jgi:thiol-disulfide isomerase/thioredoxin